MNKKSRIKTTLDSLFTGGKISNEEPKIENEKVRESPKPRRSIKIEKPEETPPPALIQPAVVVPVVAPKPDRMEMIAKENPVEISVEKPLIAQNQPVEIKPQVSSVSTKITEEERVQKIVNEIDQASLAQNEDEEHLVIFSLGKELYGVTIHSVESIIKLQAITEVPRTASFILGVTNLRGTVVPVLDLRKRFNLISSENTSNTRIVIVNAEGSKVGIVVDEVTEVLKVSRDSIQPPPPMSTTIESAFINGIARINDRLVILLDLEKVLASSSRQHQR